MHSILRMLISRYMSKYIVSIVATPLKLNTRKLMQIYDKTTYGWSLASRELAAQSCSNRPRNHSIEVPRLDVVQHDKSLHNFPEAQHCPTVTRCPYTPADSVSAGDTTAVSEEGTLPPTPVQLHGMQAEGNVVQGFLCCHSRPPNICLRQPSFIATLYDVVRNLGLGRTLIGLTRLP